MATNEILVTMPDLGDVSEACVVQWLCSEGERVSEGDDLLEVETEKTTFVIPAPEDGTLRKIAAPEGTHVQEGALLAELERA